jgi:uncharacterized membrane protein (DUF4010 family)
MAGFVSSTSATQSLAQKSNTVADVNHLVGAAVLANLASFIQIFYSSPPSIYSGCSPSPQHFADDSGRGHHRLQFLQEKRITKPGRAEHTAEDQIFSLMPALKFAALLMVIKIVTKLCLILFGQSGFIISAVIASFVGIDAIMVTLADMAGQTITFQFAFITFLIINATNLLSKSLYAYMQGKRSFALRFLLSVIIIALAGTLWLVFV